MVDAELALASLLEEARHQFGSSVTVTNEQLTDLISTTTIEPARPGALAVSWVLMGGQEIILNAGHVGGRWELLREPQDLAFLRDVVFSVAAGRARETFGPGRSQAEVTLGDGSVVVHTGYEVPPVGCLPVPLWRRQGRRVAYAPW